MDIGNMLVSVLICYYSVYFFRLVFFKEYVDVKQTNKKMDKLRKISVKTLEQQKKFLDLKYPKKDIKILTGKAKMFKWFKIFLVIMLYVMFTMFYNSVLTFFNVKIALWVAIGLMFLIPIIVNVVLSFFKLDNRNNLIDMFKR